MITEFFDMLSQSLSSRKFSSSFRLLDSNSSRSSGRNCWLRRLLIKPIWEEILNL